jgi:hypothetical protein
MAKVLRVFGSIFRYLALVVLVVAFAVVTPLWGLLDRLIIGLTSEEPYVRLVKDLGLGELAGGLLDFEELIPESVLVYLEPESGQAGEGPSQLDELKQELADAVDDAAARVAAQIPAYVAGRRDNLEGAVELGGFRRKALDIAVAKAPLGLGQVFQGTIRRGIEAAVPERIPLDPALTKLELVLEPLRIAVEGLLSAIYWLRDLSMVLLGLIALVAFRLSRAVRWAGIAFALAGGAGALLGGLLSWVLSLVVPDVVLESQIFQQLLTDSVEGYRGTAVVWAGVGVGLIALSIVAPLVGRAIGRGMTSCPLAGLVRFLVPRGGANLATALAILPATIGFGLARGWRLRRGARAALGGRVVAAVLFDGTLAVALLVLLAGDGFFGTVGWFVVGGVLVLFWALRDRPAKLGRSNLVDRLAGVRRGRRPGKRARAGSLVRSLPLIGALAASFVLPPAIPFGAVAAAEITVLMFGWPDRTLGDLLAGTRARLVRS